MEGCVPVDQRVVHRPFSERAVLRGLSLAAILLALAWPSHRAFAGAVIVTVLGPSDDTYIVTSDNTPIGTAFPPLRGKYRDLRVGRARTALLKFDVGAIP